MKAIIYCRVSSQRQVDEGNGLGSQEQRCRVYAKNKNYEVVRVFLDEAISGSLFERPAMRSLLKFIDENPREDFVVIFDDLSRYSRDVKVHIQLTAEFKSRGVKRECLNFVFDDSEESEMAELMVAVANQYQRKSNRRQVVQKMKARLEKGYWPFMPPIGLINKKDDFHGKILIPHEPYAALIKTAIEKYSDGLLLTQEEVKRFLHDSFVKAGLQNRIARSTTQEILENPLYAGYIAYEPWGVHFQKAKHEGFISIETFNKVQRRLNERSKPWKRIDYTIDFPLRTHVLCDNCGKPLTASWNTGRNGRYPNYFCRNKDCKFRWKTISKHRIEPEFEFLLLSKKPAEEKIDLAKLVFNERWSLAMANYEEWRSKIEREAKEANEKIDWYAERAWKARDEAIAQTYEDKIKELRNSLTLAEQNLDKKPYTSEEFGTASNRVLNTLKNPMDMWKSDDYIDKRTILYMYFEGQLRYDYKMGFGTASLAYPVKLIGELGQAKMPLVEMSGSEPESEQN